MGDSTRDGLPSHKQSERAARHASTCQEAPDEPENIMCRRCDDDGLQRMHARHAPRIVCRCSSGKSDDTDRDHDPAQCRRTSQGECRHHLKGQHETPPHDTQAQGQAIFQVSPDGLSVSYRLIASNIDNVVASHIHQGVVGAPGPAVVFLYGNAAPGAGRHDGVLATGTLTAANLIGPLAGQPISALVALIESGEAYVNVHTNDGVDPPNTGPGDFPAGEIRGQL